MSHPDLIVSAELHKTPAVPCVETVVLNNDHFEVDAHEYIKAMHMALVREEHCSDACIQITEWVERNGKLVSK